MNAEISDNGGELKKNSTDTSAHKHESVPKPTAYRRQPIKRERSSNSKSSGAAYGAPTSTENDGCDIFAAKDGNVSNCLKSDTHRKDETDRMREDMRGRWELPLNLRDITSWDTLVRFLCRPTDPALLGFIRFLFGLLMVFDTLLERGMSQADSRWGDPRECRFPLINGMGPLPLPWMYVVYLLMLAGSTGIMLGLAYRVSCLVYLCCYWYIFLLDKTSWNNHSYLFGLLAFFFTITDANRYWSIGALYNPKISNAHVPLWNYILIRAQIFLVYFIAGLKKLDLDWVRGYSMQYLSDHWVFYPFKFVLSNDQIDVFVVHLGGLLIDLCAGFLLVPQKTRPFALFIASMFHVMNSQLFSIGMFPYGMLCIQIIFCEADLPRRLFKRVPRSLRLFTPDSVETDCVPNIHCVYSKEEVKAVTSGESFSSTEHMPPTSPNKRHQLVTGFVMTFIAWQCFLPYSHGITKGYNNWTNGLYGYSWDMMVHSWAIQHIRISYKDRDTNNSGYLDPLVWTGGTRRWSSHGDMIKQYAHCIANNLKAYNLTNVEIYFDIWRSLNQRFQQRAIDPRVDVLRADWAPFRQTQWMMPLMVNLSDWRQRQAELISFAQQNHSFADVAFVADFPGLFLENYVQPDYGNTNLSVLAGKVIVERKDIAKNYTLEAGQTIQIPVDTFHNVHTVSSTPSSYMYVYVNMTEYTLLKKFEKFEADLNKTQSMNKTLEKYKTDPFLPYYQQFLQLEEEKKKKLESSVWTSLKAFFWHKYLILRRSIRMSKGAVYCLATNSSFDEFLNATYHWEHEQRRKAVAAAAANAATTTVS